MRKLLYIPCNQDGFLPSCSSLPFLSGLQPADIFSYFAAKTFTALILYHKPATKASRIFAKSISAICGVTSHRQFTCGKRRTHIFYPCLTDPISFRKAFPIIFSLYCVSCPPSAQPPAVRYQIGRLFPAPRQTRSYYPLR